jgi:GT2 family glycosyltransferase
MTKVSVVILNFNGEKFLQQFLPSVLRYSAEAEIIVADNGSTDNSLAVLKASFPQVRIIALDKNYGFCGGYNRALQKVDAQYYLLLNSDIEVTPGWLDPMIGILDKHADVAAVQPKILSWHERKKFEYAGAGGGFIDTLGYPFCRGRVFDRVEEDEGQYDDERQVFWATGACFMIRSKVYHQFGGLDESFFAHMEEIDLCWKINRSSQKVYYTGRSKVYHVGAGTLGYESAFKTYLNFRNGLALIFKHFDSIELLFKLPFRVLLDWLAAFVFLLKGKGKNSKSVLRAHFDFLKGYKNNHKKRKEIQKMYPFYPRTNIHPGLIVFDYYLRGKKRLKSIIPDGATLS